MNSILKTVKALYTKIIGTITYENNGFWVFGEWFGERCCDNSLYLANYIAQYHPEISCVWVAKRKTDLSALVDSIKCVEYDSEEAKSIIRNASVLIMNQGFGDLTADYSDIWGGPLKINLWHGVPWKKIGLDGSKASQLKKLYYKVQNAILSSDYYLSLSEDFTQIISSAFMIPSNRIIEFGYPRNSVFYDQSIRINNGLKLFKELKEKNSNDIKIITYMPTFRDNTSEVFTFNSVMENERLQSVLENNNAIIIEKSHFAASVKQKLKGNGRIRFLNDYPAQELLSVSDILITDYSSCFFDFLLSDRPIIHYLYDYDYYATKDRGLYYSKEDVCCGDIPSNIEDLITSIEENLIDSHRNEKLRNERRQRFLKYESSDSCKKIFEFINNKIEK